MIDTTKNVKVMLDVKDVVSFQFYLLSHIRRTKKNTVVLVLDQKYISLPLALS
jgi:hypothetical protein